MKKTMMLWLLCLVSAAAFSQNNFTPGGYNDTVFDKAGKKYALKNIAIDPGSNTDALKFPAATASCQAGYFVLHFAANSGFDAPGLPDSDRRAVLCQLFTDMSCFIRSPLNSACHSTTNTTTFVHFYIDSAGASALASATPFYTFPLNPQSPTPGITEGAVHKTIVSGVDAYLNVIQPQAIFAQSNNFYHGLIKVNNSYLWNYNMAVSNNPATQYDFYTVMLHELMHALGFNSLISPTGSSLFGNVNNYYSMYDKYLVDYLGNNIITNNNPSCPGTSYTLNPNAVVSSLTGSYCAGVSDITNCSTAPRYNDGFIDIKVYHPACYELGSTFSHFEDMCTTPAAFSSTCSPSVNPPGSNNNLYYVMSNANGTGNCYVKRFIQEEEKQVLCDLGYSVEATYNSPVAAAQHTYPSGFCNGTNIWGVNDGLNATGYTYVGSATIGIPISAVLGNDAPSATSVSCLSFVYNYPGITLSVNSGSILLAQPAGTVQYCGQVLLQYIPKNAAGQSGNITYIYAYFPCIGSCNPPNLCNLVQNGGFENLTASASTVCLGGVSPTLVNCWDTYRFTPDLLNNNCPSSSPFLIPFFSPLSTTWNGFTTNKVVFGVWGSAGPQTIYGEECVKTNLSLSPVPTNTYVASFWAFNLSKPGQNFPPKDIVFTFALGPNLGITNNSPSIPYPTGLTTFCNFTLSAADVNTWKHYTATLIYSGPANQNCLAIGCDPIQSTIAGNITTNMASYTLIDDVSILPVGLSAPFFPPSPICVGTSVNNLAQYTTLPGTFTGTGVTNSGNNYDFNAAPNNNLPAGSYPIAFTYTNGNGCVNTTISSINIAGISGSTAFCSYNNYTLTAFGYPAGTTYTWFPGGQNTSSITVSGSVTTTYTLATNNTVCPTSYFTPNVIPNTVITSNPGPWCAGQTPIQPLGIAIPNYTVPVAITQTWSANSLTVPVIFVSYTGTTNPVYTATTSVAGCTNIATYTATWFPSLNLGVTNSAQQTCLTPGQSATLTVSSNIPSASYTWQPSGSNNPTLIVTPTVTSTNYTVSGSIGSCSGSQTLNVTLSAPVTFTNLPTNWCMNQCVTYLENYLAAGTPTGGNWSGIAGTYTTIINTNSVVTGVCLSPSLNIAPGTATITYAFNPPNSSCIVINTFTVNIVKDFIVQATAQTPFCTNLGGSNTITAIAATPGPVTYTWFPGPLVGQTQTVNPGATTVYTVLASNGACTYSATATMVVSNQCCTANNQFTTSTLSAGTYSGQWAVNQNITITGNVQFGGEFRMAPNVQITVANGGVLTSNGRYGLHMYSCTDMWQGIVVNNGGKVAFTYGDLIEDAVEAISSNGSTSTSGQDIWMSYVVFNRNQKAIVIKNYNQPVPSSPFDINSCVFTCRDFGIPVGATTWPTANNISGGLRATTGSTTLLSSPYLLNNYPQANLKVPFTNQPGYAGVYIENSGTTANPTSTNPAFTSILVGEKVNANNSFFNLFDNLMYGIYGLGANVESQNNTFQNTQRAIIYSPRPHFDGGYGIYCADNFSVASNNFLTITHPSGTNNNGRINKFYDCYVGIATSNIFAADLQYADIRCSQNSALPPNIFTIAGNVGIYMRGNRFKTFKVDNNKLKNLNIGIYFVDSYGNLNLPSQPNYGQYLGKVTISNNEITPATSTVAPITVGRVSTAIYAAGILANNTPSFKEPNADLRIQNNNLNRVYRGVQLYGFNYNAYSAFVANNVITMIQEPNANQQFGVSCSNGKASVINTNTITGYNITNTLVSGVYSSMNSVNSVQCNSVTNLFAGFEFAGLNSGVAWRNNSLQTNKRGLHLTNNGIMGQQGSFSAPTDNKWLLSWTGNNGTYTDQYSFAANSKLYLRSFASPYLPPANSGSILANSYFPPGNFIAANPSAIIAPCSPAGGGGGGGCLTCKVALLDSIATDNITYTVTVPETKEINQNMVYKDVVSEPTLAVVSNTLNNFYNTNLSGSRGVYQNIEASFAQGNLNGVATLLAAFSPTTNIENNYKTYYTLVKSYLGNGSLTLSEELQLLILAHQCPFTDGSVVYDARSLYNLVNQTVIIYNDNNCVKTGFSFREHSDSTVSTQSDSELYNHLLSNETINKNKFKAFAVNYNLYPNPSQNEVNISSIVNSETVEVRINDATGKLLMDKKLIISDYLGKLELNLINGIYFVEIVNKDQKHEFKKLIISK